MVRPDLIIYHERRDSKKDKLTECSREPDTDLAVQFEMSSLFLLTPLLEYLLIRNLPSVLTLSGAQ